MMLHKITEFVDFHLNPIEISHKKVKPIDDKWKKTRYILSDP